MKSTYSIEVHGLERLIAKLDGMGPRVIQPAMLGIGELVREKMAHYPKRNTGPVKWASEKQRRWYYANRREDGLPLRYTRNSDPWSQRLGPSWKVTRHGDLGALVRTRAAYAPWVQSDEFQQPMHAATGWITDKQATDDVQHSGAVEKIVEDLVKRYW